MRPVPIWSLLLLLYWLGSRAWAQEPQCDCEPGLRHLCRCGVIIDQPMADLQLAYLNRLLLAEFREHLELSPVTSVCLAPDEEMYLEGEAALGYYDNGKIVLAHSLRRDQALKVLAHELGHACHFTRRANPNEISNLLVEGFAEWVSFHLMKRAGLTEFCFSMKQNPDPIYGKGLRWYLAIEERYGQKAVWDIMATWIDEEGKRIK